MGRRFDWRRAPHRALVLALALATATGAGADPAPIAEAYTAALAHPDRSENDRHRDTARRPAEVLALAGIRPGMHVADLMAGGGWYSEVLARVVGRDGRVYAQNNAVSASRYGRSLDRRLERVGLPQLVRIDRELEELRLPTASLDAVFLVQFYHDTLWMEVGRKAMNREVFQALSPGGIYLVIDHAAEDGSGDRDVKSLHRIDVDWVRRDVAAAGFELVAESALLANPEDDRTINVFDGDIRGRTARFALLFRKPE